MSISTLAFIIALGFVVLVAMPLMLTLGSGRRPSQRRARSTAGDGGYDGSAIFAGHHGSTDGGSDCGGGDSGGGDCGGGGDGGGGGGGGGE